MRFRSLVVCGFLLALPFMQCAAGPYDKVIAEESSTSIYIGDVTLKMSTFSREGGSYRATYKAKVFPYFFMSEHGSIQIDLSEDDLAKVARGETVEFTGRAQTSGNEERLITGRAVPTDATSGRIKVRVFVTKKIQLIFNTTYRFAG